MVNGEWSVVSGEYGAPAFTVFCLWCRPLARFPAAFAKSEMKPKLRGRSQQPRQQLRKYTLRLPIVGLVGRSKCFRLLCKHQHRINVKTQERLTTT